MTVYCVSYDLNKPGKKYEDLYKELKNSSDWWHYLDSTWLIYTQESASQLSDRIKRHLDDNDTLIVIRVTRDYAGWLTQDAWDWINKYVGN
jgi:hypothetical protein